jgi:hypothetical protein
MARNGDGIQLRGETYWLDFRWKGQRHQKRLGKNINITLARQLASVERAATMKAEAGIEKKFKDMLFEDAADEFLAWAPGNMRPGTVKFYGSSGF